MRKNTLEIKESEEPLKRLAKSRGWIELAIVVLVFTWYVVAGILWSYQFHIYSSWYLLRTIFRICFYLLILVCGIMSFRRPHKFIWLNIILGVAFIATAIYWLISRIRLLIIHVHIPNHPGPIIASIIAVSVGSAIIYLTIRIRRGLPRQAETRSDGGV